MGGGNSQKCEAELNYHLVQSPLVEKYPQLGPNLGLYSTPLKDKIITLYEPNKTTYCARHEKEHVACLKLEVGTTILKRACHDF